MTKPLCPSDTHNARLAASVHPPDWMNPTPAGRYNLVVLGGGPAGLVAAVGAAGLGAKVALVERGLLGGDCLNVGCVPSKALLRAGRAAAQVRDAARFGVIVPHGVRVDFAAVMERVRRVRADLGPNDSAARLKSLGVDVFLGAGRFVGPDALQVGEHTLSFLSALIATGGSPASPPIPGLADAGFLTNETVFSLTELPARLAVIGAGPIGCELAQAFARFGSSVHLIDVESRVLPREDADASALLAGALERDGVALHLGATLQRIENRHDGKAIHLGSVPHEPIVVDQLLVAAGRKPNVESLGLEAAGVDFDAKHGVKVSDGLKTSTARIYAAGDVCSRFQFTHAADAMARIVLRNALFPFGRASLSALTIPWCTYTDPEIAHVGLYEQEAKERGISVQVYDRQLRDIDRAVLDGADEGFARILVAEGTDRILGATIVAAHAGEMISEISLAIAGGLGLSVFADTIHPYPTYGETFKKIGDAYNRTRLTPFVKWLMDKWLSWGR
ncbi:MAG: mercuric reductase [Planctomycetes bacterium]|nr:mercuric reductase [Planctomycetota bacterium]